MNVTRFDVATEYFPEQHYNMRCLRLQGHEAGPSDQLWLGVSIIEPGGSTSASASAVEKHYVVLDGALTVETDDGAVVLLPRDSCRLAPGERRKLMNATLAPVTVLLAMPYRPSPA